jgi:hypothetical protein
LGDGRKHYEIKYQREFKHRTTVFHKETDDPVEFDVLLAELIRGMDQDDGHVTTIRVGNRKAVLCWLPNGEDSGPIILSGNVPEGRSYHVDEKNGDDRNPGTEAAPLKTLKLAQHRAKPGDSIVIHR